MVQQKGFPSAHKLRRNGVRGDRAEPWSADFAHSFPFQTLLELLIHKGRQVKTISFHSQTGDQQRFTLPIDYLSFIQPAREARGPEGPAR